MEGARDPQPDGAPRAFSSAWRSTRRRRRPRPRRRSGRGSCSSRARRWRSSAEPSTTSSARPRIAAIEPGMLVRRLGHRQAALADEADRLRPAGRASAAPSAANSPTEWPTTKSGTMPRARIASLMARLVATSAGCCTFVSSMSSTGPWKQMLAEIDPGRLAAGLVHRHRLGHGLGDLAAHAGLVRALAGEHEGDLGHRAAPFRSSVHSISAEPHVRPAPIPVISTSCRRAAARRRARRRAPADRAGRRVA